MRKQIALIPNTDSRHFIRQLPSLLNEAQRDFNFIVEDGSSLNIQSSDLEVIDVEVILKEAYSSKNILGLANDDLVIQFTNKTLESATFGLTNLFVAGSNLHEFPPRVAVISTSFIRKHILPNDPNYILQKHAFYHLMVTCILGAFLEMEAHEDRGCLLDFNSYTPNIRRKLEAGYSFCNACLTQVNHHPLGEAVQNICGALKVGIDIEPTSLRPEALRIPKVFISYAGADRPLVLSLYEKLKEDGFSPWLDKKDLLPGQDWELEIRKAIKSSDFFLACISRSFQHRTYGHKEIKLALEVLDSMPEGSIFLIPVRLEDCTVEDRLTGRHWVDMFDRDGYKMLIRALRWNNPNNV